MRPSHFEAFSIGKSLGRKRKREGEGEIKRETGSYRENRESSEGERELFRSLDLGEKMTLGKKAR